ncbi:MAG: AI-2E family transporter [Defluviitaleaceae bacterium]|nr:AI-2E family transporter [Defluviitaleaceae bacterium]
MKLPWDKNYLKIALHVIVTVASIYALMQVIDFLAYIIFDIGAVLVAFFSFIGTVLRVFQPLFIALIIAYLLDPLAEFFQKHYELRTNEWFNKGHFAEQMPQRLADKKIKIKSKPKKEKRFKTRIAGAVLSYLSIMIFLYIIIHLLAFNLGGTDNQFLELAETTIMQLQIIVQNIEYQLYQLGLDFLEVVLEQVAGLFEGISYVLIDLVNNVVSTAAAAGTLVLNFFISLVVAFYILVHKQAVKYHAKYLADLFLPKIVVKKTTKTVNTINTVFSGYMRGLILDGIILGTLIGIVLSIIGVELAILIGVLTAVFNLIPYFGGIMAFVISIVSELVLGTPSNAFWAAIAIIVIQQIDSIFIVPRIVGRKVSLSAPIVILSLSIGGTLFGIAGMFLAVPVVAVLKIALGGFIERYAKIKEEAKKEEVKKEKEENKSK